MTGLIDRELASDSRLSSQERGVYLAVRSQLPRAVNDVARICGLSVPTTSRACSHLVTAGWIRIEQSGRLHRPYPSVPPEVQVKQVQLLEEIYPMQRYKGEFLTKVILDVFVPDRDYIENARPEFLTNPITKEPMELDRLYRRAKKAVEHHGPQHFAPTKAYPNPDDCRMLQARDLMKRGRCLENGVDLIVVTTHDLSPAGIPRRISAKIATIPADRNGPFIQKLTQLCANYRATASEKR